MNDVIDLIIDYYKEKNTKILLQNLEISVRDLNIIVIEILSWLKLEHKREKWIAEGKKVSLKPLTLNSDFTWCQNLKLLVESEKMFKDNFIIKNNGFDFAICVSDEEKKLAREKAFKEYNPLRRS